MGGNDRGPRPTRFWSAAKTAPVTILGPILGPRSCGPLSADAILGAAMLESPPTSRVGPGPRSFPVAVLVVVVGAGRAKPPRPARSHPPGPGCPKPTRCRRMSIASCNPVREWRERAVREHWPSNPPGPRLPVRLVPRPSCDRTGILISSLCPCTRGPLCCCVGGGGPLRRWGRLAPTPVGRQHVTHQRT